MCLRLATVDVLNRYEIVRNSGYFYALYGKKTYGNGTCGRKAYGKEYTERNIRKRNIRSGNTRTGNIWIINMQKGSIRNGIFNQ